MSRIIAGKFKGRRLTVPKGMDIRPTTDQMRERLFSMLNHARYPNIQGARVADLFAGTGALGLEALSRGAKEVVFVEKSASSITTLKSNITTLGAVAETHIHQGNAQILPLATEPYSFIFMDPPYRQGLVEPTLKNIITNKWLAKGGVIVCELATDETLTLPPELTLIDERTQGQQRVLFLIFGN